MFKRFSVGNKISLLTVGLIMVSVFSISFIAYRLSELALEDRYRSNLNNVADIKLDRVNHFFKTAQSNIESIASLSGVSEAIGGGTSNTSEAILPFGDEAQTTEEPAADQITLDPNDPMMALMGADFGDVASQEPTANSTTEEADNNFSPQESYKKDVIELKNRLGFENLHLLDAEGKIFYCASPNGEADQVGKYYKDPDGNVVANGKDNTYFSSVFKNGVTFYTVVSTPISNQQGKLVGIAVGLINMQTVFDLLQDTTGLGHSGETAIGKIYDNQIVLQNPLRHDSTTALTKSVLIGSAQWPSLQKAVKGESSMGYETDYRGKLTLATGRHLTIANWGMVVKIDHDEILEPIKILRKYFLIFGLTIIVISFVLTYSFTKVLTRPLIRLKEVMGLLGQGILPREIEHETNDEIGEMGDRVNDLVSGLKRTAEFAGKIGQGNLESEFEPLSDQDTLGLALLDMRTSLQQAELRDEERNHIVRGVAELSEILRRHNNIEQLADEVTAYMSKKSEAVQAALFVIEKNENDKTDKGKIVLASTYAYNKKKYTSATYRIGEGLIGQVVLEKDTIIRTEIPADYVTITSGLLGDQRPKCLLIQPLISNDVVYGIIELTSFEMFKPRSVNFVKEVSQILAQTIFNIQVNERTRRLLEASQKMSSELQQQQEELRQNAEEMAATQEELKRSNLQLEQQIEEVNRAQKKMQVLLSNASEVITIYERDMTIRYISPSVEKIFGYTPDEMIGIKDIRYVHSEGVRTVEGMFQSLLRNPNDRITIQYSYGCKNGDRIWIEATGSNQLDDEAIQGIVVNQRDITERRKAEKESRLRGQMQALSENSPDLITRVGRKGELHYINPVIQDYTGIKPDELVNRENTENEKITLFSEVLDKAGILSSLRQILNQVLEANQKLSVESAFDSVMGQRVAQVAAIPEYNEDKKLETVLFVSHDITERKLIELEIQNKNKKITESINYARRIQTAILPSRELISEAFSDSFILYRPRDVVSGDFPWFMNRGDEVFIAAVDCTGHGVPGALISLIGYFLLNNIIENHERITASHALDLLDAAVTRTLKQDGADAGKTRDGMDIALCKVNLKTNTLEYAGAHRPLYYHNGTELVEYKGDRYPIGGGQYTDREQFTNHVIEYKKGDVALFFSDGFPDQFGGPEVRKFSPKRIREIMTENINLPMEQLHDTFNQAFDNWMHGQKQTDDVLMIGIRF